ncbi:MAG: hypothetical protein R3292_11220 [Alcanivorax sp.]|nr:hypothetical protein [Alcanivorax sp.]
MRLLLVLTVIIAVSVLLWGSWQMSRKLFAGVLTAVLIITLLLAAGMWENQRYAQVEMPAEGIALSLTDVGHTESSVTLSGQVANHGKLAVAALNLQAQALRCPVQQPCEVIYKESIPLQLYLPPGSHYPFTVVSRPPDPSLKADRWQLKVLNMVAYPADKR